MMVEMTKEMKAMFDTMDDTEKIRMFYELVVYLHNNMEYSDDCGMNSVIDDIATIKEDIERL